MQKSILGKLIRTLLIVPFLVSTGSGQGRGYTLQIASEPTESEARALVADLKAKGIEAYWVKAEVPGKGTRYRVRIGKFKSQSDARAIGERAFNQKLIKEYIVTLYDAPGEGEIAAQKVAARPIPAEQKGAPDRMPARPAGEGSMLASKPAAASPAAKPTAGAPEIPPEEAPRPQAGKERKPEPAVEPLPLKAEKEPAPVPSAREKAAREPISMPAITVSPVPEALADVTISNDNWKIVRRSAETDKNLRAIHFVDSMTGWAAGDAGAVYRTTDGGRSWKPLLAGAPANINFIYFIDWNTGWMIGEKSDRDEEPETLLYMTTNGGKTWSHKPMPNILSLHFIDARTGWAVGRNATLMKTTDGGNEWAKIDSMEKLIGLPVESTSYTYGFRDLHFVDSQHGWLVGNFYGRARSNIGGVFMTEDGGATWKRVPITIQTQHTSGRFTPGVYHSVRFTDNNLGSVTGEMYDGEGRYFFVLHTRDGGRSWEQYRTPSRAVHNTQFLDPSYGWSAAFAPREGEAEAVVYDTTLMRTDNGGMSWRNDFIAKGRRIRGVFFLSPTRGWAVGDRGMILRYEEKAKTN
ncbi:MAG: YCF48-related protein [Blastocatellia bacterium]